MSLNKGRLYARLIQQSEGNMSLPQLSLSVEGIAPTTATTTTGFGVKAHLLRKRYKKVVKIPDAQMPDLVLSNDETLPKWNNTIAAA